MKESGYDTAQICLNGHVINSAVQYKPSHSASFCQQCGQQAITACPSCNKPIRGEYIDLGTIGIGAPPYTPPSFCHNCGKAYPWIDTRLQAAKELASEVEELTDEERDLLGKSLDDIVRDSPRTTIAATRFKKLMAKAGEGAAESFRQILVDVLTEAARKQIWS